MTNQEIEQLMVTSFLGYKYRKQHDVLYSHDANVPTTLIYLYFSNNVDRLVLNEISKGFIEKYKKNESVVEAVIDEDEIEGIAVMCETMLKMPEDEFDLSSIITFHRALYSKSKAPEFGGKFRQTSAYIKEFPVDLCDPRDILKNLYDIESVFLDLKQMAKQIRETHDYSYVKTFVNECVKFNCKLIKIHPFPDGNKRTSRCMINKLFSIAGIPPVYIDKSEKDEYRDAIKEALRYRSAGEIDDDSKYDMLTNFYLYKICDSIIELDINKRLKKERVEGKYELKKKKTPRSEKK